MSRCPCFRFQCCALATLALFGAMMSIASPSRAADWPSWRGPHQNGISSESGLIDEFDPKGGEGSHVLWKNPAAGGISTPAVFGSRLYTIVRDQPGTPKDAEKVICLDTVSGKVIWENVYNVFLSDLPAERVGWSHVAVDPDSGNVFALGACCLLQCIDGQTGKTIWARSLSEEFGMLSTYGGRTNTPVVFEDLVIISGVTTGWDTTATPAHRFLAFDKSTGQLVWLTGTNPFPEDTTYSTPVIAVIGGQQVMVAGAGDGYLYGMQPRTGVVLWKVHISRRGINTSPVVDDRGQVYATHGEENPTGTLMGAVVRIDGTAASSGSQSAEVWRTEELMVGKSSPLLIDGRLYVVEDSAELHVLDAETGEEIGSPIKLGTAMRGSLVYADGKIYGCTSAGIFHVLSPTEDGLESIFKVRLPRGHEVGGSPVVAGGRIYLPTTAGLYCLGAEGAPAPTGTSTVSQPSEDHSLPATAAHLQLVPAEAIVTSGTELAMSVAAFNSAGQRLSALPTDLQFEVTGEGSVDESGMYRAPETSQHLGVTVTVRSGDLVGSARLRVIPPLPWSFGFADNQVPVTWIGARYRHEPRVIDKDPAIVKITTIPKGTRSQSWMGPTDLRHYTVTADVKAGQSSKLPDIGLIAQRYTLDMMGESQQLQIRTWPAQLRMAQTVPFTWEADRWYRLKIQATTEQGVAVLRGKAWPRGEEEPSQWTVTATDAAPNLNGSPGLFGNATNAEIVIDNVSVVPNP